MSDAQLIREAALTATLRGTAIIAHNLLETILVNHSAESEAGAAAASSA